jgi:CRP-like cAMP-binding protein
MNPMVLQELRLFRTPQRGPNVQLDPSAFLADPELIQAFEKRATPICCDGDRVLFRQGDAPDGLYILKKGEATLTMNSGSEEPIFTVQAAAGSLLGLPGLIGNQPYSLTAVARGGAQVGFIARNDFNSLMQSELPLLVKVLQVLAAEVRSARLAITQM